MAVLLSAVEISKSFGSRTLFRDLTFSIESFQKIGLIGPNGAGKSTLLKMMARQEKPDDGKMHFGQGLRIGYLSQQPEFNPGESVFEAIAAGDYDADHLSLVQEMISRLELDTASSGVDRPVSELSGGWQKRVALARELVRRPDLLLLDEPTNHLDVESILWLEDFLGRQRELALLTVTHDRLFLQNTCDYIFDLDPRNPEGMIKYDGSYADFVDFKASLMNSQQRLEETKKNTLRRETEWLRRGAKARQTKQKARIERAHDLKDDVKELENKNRDRRVDLDFGDVARNPKKIIDAKGIGKEFSGRWLFRNFDFTLGPRSRVALLGTNGCGKSTLIKTLLGEVEPDEGTIFRSDLVEIAHFEQDKGTLDPNISVLKTICPDGDNVIVQGQSVFARSYLSRFLFRGEQMDQPVGKLSGGEKSRLRLAQLMSRSEPVLILDEPTNDLDLATLDLLEDALANFGGALILVTHDRYFMDRVANEIWAFTEDEGEMIRFADVLQWQKWFDEKGKSGSSKNSRKESPAAVAAPKKKVKLSFKEQHELDTMEKTISEAEAKLSALQKDLALPENTANYGKLQILTKTMEEQQSKVEGLYRRWEELNNKVSGV